MDKELTTKEAWQSWGDGFFYAIFLVLVLWGLRIIYT